MINMKRIIDEFKDFAMRGSVIDLAIGIIIGASFQKIVSSIVNDIVMPPIGLLLGQVDFSNLYINLSGKTFLTLAEAETAGVPIIKYGLFLNTLIEFAIIAFVIFILVKQINKLQNDDSTTTTPTTKKCPYCISTIPLKATKCKFCASEVK